MAQLTEQNILDAVYEMLEGDDEHWDTSDSEYVIGRSYCNAAIARWENYDNTQWRELWTPSSDSTASDATLTTTSGVYAYTCPSNMRYPSSYVRLVSGGSSDYYTVISPDRIAEYDDQDNQVVYFTGSVKDGLTLHFNPELTIPQGSTISYEYYKQATKFTATTTKPEMDDPYFIVYFALSRFYEVDGEDGKAMKAIQEAEDRLETMRTRNMSPYNHIYDPITDVLDYNSGFGY